jgi:isoleucyl-tRNA synthetase
MTWCVGLWILCKAVYSLTTDLSLGLCRVCLRGTSRLLWAVMKPVKPDVHFPSLEEGILAFWNQNQIVEKGLKANQGKEPFIFYDGPPFATGLPHYGHILPGTLKDIVPRYWVMKGKYVERRWGWDCHGVPVEFELEKELGLNGLADVQKMGIANFNEACRGIVQRFTKEWEEVITRTGRWADFKNAYRTMDPKYMETVWWITRQLFDKGLVYEGHRVMPYSWRISTPLSNFEAGLNYKEVQDPALTLRFKLTGSSTNVPVGVQARYILAWTTTPWTLPANLALAVGKEIAYVEVSTSDKPGESYIVAADRVSAYFEGKELKEHGQYTGAQLVGWKYEPLFPHFADRASQGAFQVYTGDHVTATDGTGIVHTAPAHGEEDYAVCQRAGIELVDATDEEGKFTDLVPEYKGINFKEADKLIVRDLKAKGSVFRHDTFTHNYPFCWRSDTPLMNKAISTWFVKLEPLKKRLVENNKTTHWVPEALRDGRFGNWLENARDWNISRNRFWGTPLPLWRSEDKEEVICIGSVDELHTLSGQRPADLHKHFVDDITFKSPKSGKLMRRIPEVFDCWFESGSMPYAQQHYPFDPKFKDPEAFKANFPADFIAEGVDQTRGWFYTLSVLSTALFDTAPFKNVVVNGFVLAEDGKKMSKRMKNYPEPKKILNEYGADALRAYLMTSPAAHGEDLRFSEAGVKEVIRSVLLPLWNSYSFFVTYAEADGWKPENFKASDLENLENDLDRWIISRLQTLIQKYEVKMNEYHLYEVIPEVTGFIDGLTNWYIRLNRGRFWSDEKGRDKDQAYATLYFTLTQFAKVLAPILPFITEEIYQNLKGPADTQESVHLSTFPTFVPNWLNPELEANMALVEAVVSMGRNCRSTNKLKTRQPLREIKVITRNPSDKKTIEAYQALIAQELNVKTVSFSSDEGSFVTLSTKANAKVLGPRLGQKMKAILQKVKELTPEAVGAFEKKGSVELDGETILLSEVTIERQPKIAGAMQSSGSVTIWLDSTVDEALIAEGQAREFVNRVQKLRKDSGLKITDRVRIKYYTPDASLGRAVETHKVQIASQILAESVTSVDNAAWSTEQDIDGIALKLHLERA